MVTWLIFVVVLTIAPCNVEGDGDDTKLKIEVVLKPAQCEKSSNNGDILHVLYNGTLEAGEIFDDINNEDAALEFQLGSRQVIEGLDKGLKDMCIGEKRKLAIPPHMGYGETGDEDLNVPPNAKLFYEVTLIHISEAQDMNKLFEKLDVDGNGQLSPDELFKEIKENVEQEVGFDHQETDKYIAEMFQTQDKDKDGSLSKQEFLSPPMHDEL